MLWNQTNATASDDGAGDTAARAAAGLCTCEDVTAEALFTLPECREFVALRALAATMTFVTAIGVVVVNMLFGRLMRTLAGYERHATATNQELALSGRLFTRMFLNTAILAVLINADVNRILRELGLSSIQCVAHRRLDTRHTRPPLTHAARVAELRRPSSSASSRFGSSAASGTKASGLRYC